jgi:hypothetical protein
MAAFAGCGALAFAAVSITIDGVATPGPAEGWIAVLQRGENASSEVNLTILPVTAGAVGPSPEVQIAASVCGPKAFEGALLLGGKSRLRRLRVLSPPAPIDGPSPTRPGHPIVETRDLRFLDASTQAFVTEGSVQVVRLALPAIHCAVPFTPNARQPGFVGAAAVVTGSMSLRVQNRWKAPLNLWPGPRLAQTWPYIGALPFISTRDLGEYRFVQGLSGRWSRPARSYFGVDVGALKNQASVDAARPSLASSTELSWSSSEPFAATARLTITDELRWWQSALIVATIWLAVGGSLLAALLLELLRSPEPAAHVSPITATEQQAPGRRRFSAIWLAGLAGLAGMLAFRVARSVLRHRRSLD